MAEKKYLLLNSQLSEFFIPSSVTTKFKFTMTKHHKTTSKLHQIKFEVENKLTTKKKGTSLSSY